MSLSDRIRWKPMTPAERTVLRRVMRVRPIPTWLAMKNPVSRALLWALCLFSQSMRDSKRWRDRHERHLALPVELEPMHPPYFHVPYTDYTYANTKKEAQ